jgi:dipeptidyl aminopeptidase/acylaminoacyl peptidase
MRIRELRCLSLYFQYFVVVLAAPAQQAVKRPLTHADYDGWRSIQGQQLSRDGKLVAYALSPQDGDGEVVVRNLATGAEWRHGRGKRPDPSTQQPDAATEPITTGPRRGFGRGGEREPADLSLTADGRWLVFQIYPRKAELEAARKRKARPDEMPKNAMGIMDLSSGQVARVERVRRFQVPEEGNGFVAYLLEPKTEERRPSEDRPQPAAQAAGERRRAPRRPDYGSDLVLRKLSDSSERVFPDVLEFSLTKDCRTLVYAVGSRKPETNGVYAVTVGSADAPAALVAGKGKYSRLSWDEKQTQLAFLGDPEERAQSQPALWRLYGWDRKSASAVELVSAATPAFPAGRVVSDRGAISFSQDGRRIFFGLGRPSEPEKEDDVDERPVVDLWHWKDDFIQPMQKVRAENERNRSYRAVFHLDTKKFLPLADETMPEANPSNNGRWALGGDDRNYRTLVGYDTTYSDYYIVDTANAARKLVVKKHAGAMTWSSNGRYGLFFDGRDWSTVSVPEGKTVNLTRALGVNFWDEEHDSPGSPPSYGSGGWTKDDTWVLLYDRYDVWQVAPDGSRAKNLTDGVGRKEKLEFRLVRLEAQERAVDPEKPLLLRVESETTHDSGFYRDRIDGGLPQKLVMAPKNFSSPAKAKDADVMLLTASTFNEFPDLLVAGADFRDLRKISDANPQKRDLLWGSSELIRYKNTDGVPLTGMLIKPDNFDPNKKYPMLVYIYETLSQGLHRFVDPRPSHSINASYYASNGYLVLEPDIVYTIGYPGQSALKCVLPAIQAVVDKGFVDERAIGIQGHSWGGYQIAYMVTQTNRFRAAAPGALVANMTSAYSGIRWGTGLPRQFQYERTQSRIGGTLWEYPMRFLENSAVFRADRVQTPILMLHNDGDDAVPWYQGIEFYLALRRLGKPVYMFNYNGEPHGLRKRVNQKDYTVRLQQFFDHQLKGAPMPEWMSKGVSYLDRDKEKERIKPTTDGKQVSP